VNFVYLLFDKQWLIYYKKYALKQYADLKIMMSSSMMNLIISFRLFILFNRFFLTDKNLNKHNFFHVIELIENIYASITY